MLDIPSCISYLFMKCANIITLQVTHFLYPLASFFIEKGAVGNHSPLIGYAVFFFILVDELGHNIYFCISYLSFWGML